MPYVLCPNATLCLNIYPLLVWRHSWMVPKLTKVSGVQMTSQVGLWWSSGLERQFSRSWMRSRVQNSGLLLLFLSDAVRSESSQVKNFHEASRENVSTIQLRVETNEMKTTRRRTWVRDEGGSGEGTCFESGMMYTTKEDGSDKAIFSLIKWSTPSNEECLERTMQCSRIQNTEFILDI